jgi:hypothetical protein
VIPSVVEVEAKCSADGLQNQARLGVMDVIHRGRTECHADEAVADGVTIVASVEAIPRIKTGFLLQRLNPTINPPWITVGCNGFPRSPVSLK